MSKIICFYLLVLSLLTGQVISQWQQQLIPNASMLNCVCFFNPQNAVTGGWNFADNTVNGRIFYSTNGGSGWVTSVYPDSLRAMISISFIDQQIAYGFGACDISTPDFPSFPLYRKFRILPNEPIGFNNYRMTGGGMTGGVVIKTTDTGRSWFQSGIIPSNVIYLYGGVFQNSITGFALANTFLTLTNAKTGIIKTTNGLNWNFVFSPDSAHELYSIKFFDINTGLAVGFDRDYNAHFIVQGLIIRTTNSGVSWVKQRFYWVNNFKDAAFANSTTGFACGVNNSDSMFSGVVYKTTNAGASWNINYSIDTVFFQGINFFPGTGRGYAFGSKLEEDPKSPGVLIQKKYVISRTTDYGQTWYTFYQNDSTSYLTGSNSMDQDKWFISGGDFYNGIILKTTNGGGPISINPISTQIPSVFTLYQNFPNPFNPSTKIRFDIPNQGNIIFNVYDALGKSVYSLHERKPAGSYEITFDGSNYSSGIYYYSLTTGNFTETKKMVLVK